MNILIVIPARGGSKGIPYKNVKELNGRPLIYYTIDIARQITSDDNIYVSTDNDNIIKVVEKYGLSIPFKRPEELATDCAGASDVVLHALSFYESINRKVDVIILLQPTSPFRRELDVKEMIKLYNPSIDMVVSVKEAVSNPYYNSFEENKDGSLIISKGDGKFERRQDAPKTWEFNGSIYIINPNSLRQKGMSGFTCVKKYVMDDYHSVDLDTPFDWKIAELMIKEKLVE